MQVQVQALSSAHSRTGFNCGHPQLNHWLENMSGQQQARNITRTFVAVDISHPATILGFYSLTASAVHHGDLPNHKRYPEQVPVVRLGRFATRKEYQGRGIGEFMLLNALDKVREASMHIGIAAVVIDAKDEQAASFYAKRGFLPSPGNLLQLFLFTRTLQQAYEQA